MKKGKKEIIEILKTTTKKESKFENLVLNLALQKMNSDKFEFDGKAVYTADKSTIVYCIQDEEELRIPQATKIIGRMAFTQHQQLKNIVIPEGIEKIEREAFFDCDQLQSVVFPTSLKGIYGFSFSDCDELKKVTFKNVPEHLGRRSFSDCDSLREIHVPAGTADVFRKAFRLTMKKEKEMVSDQIKKKYYVERDVSWMYFNHRILTEAEKEEVPLLERLSFLGIYSNNLDEFFRVRVASLTRIVEDDHLHKKEIGKIKKTLKTINHL